jgi:hypothetical protein
MIGTGKGNARSAVAVLQAEELGCPAPVLSELKPMSKLTGKQE